MVVLDLSGALRFLNGILSSRKKDGRGRGVVACRCCRLFPIAIVDVATSSALGVSKRRLAHHAATATTTMKNPTTTTTMKNPTTTGEMEERLIWTKGRRGVSRAEGIVAGGGGGVTEEALRRRCGSSCGGIIVVGAGKFGCGSRCQ